MLRSSTGLITAAVLALAAFDYVAAAPSPSPDKGKDGGSNSGSGKSGSEDGGDGDKKDGDRIQTRIPVRLAPTQAPAPAPAPVIEPASEILDPVTTEEQPAVDSSPAPAEAPAPLPVVQPEILQPVDPVEEPVAVPEPAPAPVSQPKNPVPVSPPQQVVNVPSQQQQPIQQPQAQPQQEQQQQTLSQQVPQQAPQIQQPQQAPQIQQPQQQAPVVAPNSEKSAADSSGANSPDPNRQQQNPNTAAVSAQAQTSSTPESIQSRTALLIVTNKTPLNPSLSPSTKTNDIDTNHNFPTMPPSAIPPINVPSSSPNPQVPLQDSSIKTSSDDSKNDLLKVLSIVAASLVLAICIICAVTYYVRRRQRHIEDQSAARARAKLAVSLMRTPSNASNEPLPSSKAGLLTRSKIFKPKVRRWGTVTTTSTGTLSPSSPSRSYGPIRFNSVAARDMPALLPVTGTMSMNRSGPISSPSISDASASPRSMERPITPTTLQRSPAATINRETANATSPSSIGSFQMFRSFNATATSPTATIVPMSATLDVLDSAQLPPRPLQVAFGSVTSHVISPQTPKSAGSDTSKAYKDRSSIYTDKGEGDDEDSKGISSFKKGASSVAFYSSKLSPFSMGFSDMQGSALDSSIRISLMDEEHLGP
ncbi:hypothetical protein HDU97_002718 [Phlyctochytrium planicorne]|nr:hypothetical protein HDU97_002718 [Phlyctochytrium planicorne]